MYTHLLGITRKKRPVGASSAATPRARSGKGRAASAWRATLRRVSAALLLPLKYGGLLITTSKDGAAAEGVGGEGEGPGAAAEGGAPAPTAAPLS